MTAVRDTIRGILAGDDSVAALTGPRVYTRRGPYGGISLDDTPEAFTSDGDLLPSLVVVQEVRSSAEAVKPGDPETLMGVQTVAIYAYQHAGYDVIDQLITHAKRLLHRVRGADITPDTWVESRWQSDGPDQIDPALARPVRATRFDVVIREQIQ